MHQRMNKRGLDEADKENMPKEGGSITYTDSAEKQH